MKDVATTSDVAEPLPVVVYEIVRAKALNESIGVVYDDGVVPGNPRNLYVKSILENPTIPVSSTSGSSNIEATADASNS